MWILGGSDTKVVCVEKSKRVEDNLTLEELIKLRISEKGEGVKGLRGIKG